MGNNKGRSKGCVTCVQRRVKCGKSSTHNWTTVYVVTAAKKYAVPQTKLAQSVPDALMAALSVLVIEKRFSSTRESK
jgi:hypothetical protein